MGKLTRIRLPATSTGKTVRLRFHAGTAGTGDLLPGWYIENIRCPPEAEANPGN